MNNNQQDKKIEFDTILNCYKCTECWSFGKRKDKIIHSNDCSLKNNEQGITLNEFAKMIGIRS